MQLKTAIEGWLAPIRANAQTPTKMDYD